MHALALVFLTGGDGVDKNHNESAKLFQQAANLGFQDSMIELANCYRLATGVKKDLVLAYVWYMRGIHEDSDPKLVESIKRFYQSLTPAQKAEARYSVPGK